MEANAGYWPGRANAKTTQSLGLPAKGYREGEEHAGVCTSPGIVETDTANDQKRGKGLLEQIIATANLLGATKRVKTNRGSGGADDMLIFCRSRKVCGAHT